MEVCKKFGDRNKIRQESIQWIAIGEKSTKYVSYSKKLSKEILKFRFLIPNLLDFKLRLSQTFETTFGSRGSNLKSLLESL